MNHSWLFFCHKKNSRLFSQLFLMLMSYCLNFFCVRALNASGVTVCSQKFQRKISASKFKWTQKRLAKVLLIHGKTDLRIKLHELHRWTMGDTRGNFEHTFENKMKKEGKRERWSKVKRITTEKTDERKRKHQSKKCKGNWGPRTRHLTQSKYINKH